MENPFKIGFLTGSFVLFTYPEPHGICERNDQNDEKEKLET